VPAINNINDKKNFGPTTKWPQTIQNDNKKKTTLLPNKCRKMGWRLGLQAVTGLVSLSFFMALLYRPASLYHPQRRAILHLKNQRKKVSRRFEKLFICVSRVVPNEKCDQNC
jgi:hypothetical protein